MLFELITFVVTTISSFIVITVFVVAGILYLTKPNDRSFKKDLKHSSINSKSIMKNFTNKMAINVLLKASNTNIKDYILFKHAELKLPNNEKLHFIGILQNWFNFDPEQFD